ncbi:MAG: phosphoribosyl-AMP cyclohydrolase [Verrucomicrobiae bacterium]|nr:phosphoribosyl-AMP cyclohydrolase [Verrucomicrobiae bacterium]
MPTEPDIAVEALRDKLTSASRVDKNAIEKDLAFAPKFDASGLITAVTVDADSGEVLMVAYMNEESLAQTLAMGEAVYFSRSRQKLWHKGATSGHTQEVIEIRTDCDQDALVLRVRQKGPGCCHAGYGSCFYRSVPLAAEQTGAALVLHQIADATYNPEDVY